MKELDSYVNIWYHGIASRVVDSRGAGRGLGFTGEPAARDLKSQIPIRGPAAERGSGRMTAPFAAATTARRRLFGAYLRVTVAVTGAAG